MTPEPFEWDENAPKYNAKETSKWLGFYLNNSSARKCLFQVWNQDLRKFFGMQCQHKTLEQTKTIEEKAVLVLREMKTLAGESKSQDHNIQKEIKSFYKTQTEQPELVFFNSNEELFLLVIDNIIKVENKDGVLGVILDKKRDVKKRVNEFGQQLHQKTCHCHSLPDKEKCRQQIVVRCRNVEGLSGKILREFQDANKVPIPTGRQSPVGSILINGEDYMQIKRQPNVLFRCGQDITTFIDVDTEKEIGGVSFGALKPVLKEIKRHHKFVIENYSGSTVNCSKNDRGTMVPTGSQVPQGILPRDTYSAYKSTQIDPVDLEGSTRMLLDMGFDVDIALEVLRCGSKTVYEELIRAAEKAGTYSLGTHGLNVFYCQNYVVPQHIDNDETWTINNDADIKDRGGKLFQFCVQHGTMLPGGSKEVISMALCLLLRIQ
ncbi:hypothetical protein K435DRAFT_808698 [Dendrothele bispora CBS 962.96]|uniref:Uncharacterized protein n=1 Tax=Dendrothele bispora (strain CBS 962.96) TaxID=1314807 RepID=A0A4S8L1S2_DENBC|nr:hypothetical protein K435DRAFT_808698 [Dendrothele bispora CBS 962.96]